MSKGDHGSLRNSYESEDFAGLTASPDENHGEAQAAVVFLPMPSPPDSRSPSPRPQPKRQSSLSQPRPDDTPRTMNRVRFDPEEHVLPSRQMISLDLDAEDYMDSDSQHAPLLTDITPPSESPFLSGSFQAEDHLPNARPKSGMRSAFMNMANSIIGAGIIGQPYAFRQAGLTMGVILLISLTVMVDWTIRLIVVNSKLSGVDSFQATMQHCFGKPGLIAISIAQWAFAFGGMLAFCIIIGDTIPHVIEALFPSLKDVPFLWLLTNRKAVIVLFVLAISWPLSLYRDIAKLAKASTAALISMLIIIVTVVTNGPVIDKAYKGSTEGLLFVNNGFFQAVGVISFAFVCHHNSLLIYGSLRTPTMDRFSTVTHYSTFVSCVACLIVALVGFLTFGDLTKGNVLNNFPTQGNIMVQIARLCFGLNMLTTLPLECFVCREVMNNYYFPDEPYQPNRHLIFSTSLVVSAMVISLMTSDLGAVFELIGATSACVLAYILPPLCYIKLSTRSWKTVPAALCICFGIAVMTTTLTLTTVKMLKSG
ncbi:hypothetical protein LTR64_007036 [Lithohypha guttulata]|uniref:uncharacterized protein n=1 Tax=Lithohypha guttulata TaxID=1690604 RepID=UPI002DDE88F2|nr:hypothetical protein LTR51_004407 [Lithohypha guttulata]